MTNEEMVLVCIKANADLKEKYRTFHSDILLEEIISRIQAEKNE